ncbi:MAG: LptF/LptG family permease, partial [Thiovulaceae bacterium]|nr:LptF/LptG family permease [Sulfurimonadaceae bacterium]
MHKLRRYIISNFSISFFSIFLPLFAISSVIFMIKLAAYTAYIQLDVWEMFELYLFVLPELFFYTLPLTFFVAAALALFRLSTDNEMVVFFTLGIKPNYLIKVLMKPALLLTALLFFDFFYLFPHVKTLSINFVKYKKSEAKFNLSASEFGHNFG